MKKTRGFLLAVAFATMAFTVISCGDETAFVGKWLSIDGSGSTELFKDGTGVVKQKTKKGGEESIAIQWKVMDKRFIYTVTVLGSLVSEAFDYEISGNKLALIDDKGKRDTYVKTQELKPQEGKSGGPELADSRDSKKYKSVKIGTQTWMAEIWASTRKAANAMATMKATAKNTAVFTIGQRL